MAATLRDIMLAPQVQPKVIEDGLALVDEQISDRTGPAKPLRPAAAPLEERDANHLRRFNL